MSRRDSDLTFEDVVASRFLDVHVLVGQTAMDRRKRMPMIRCGNHENVDGLIIKKRWLDTYQSVLAQEDIEVFFVPESMRDLKITIRGLEDIQQLRARLRLTRKEQSQLMESISRIQRFYNRRRRVALPSR